MYVPVPHIAYCQEPITWSKKFPYVRAMVLSQARFLKIDFPANVGYQKWVLPIRDL